MINLVSLFKNLSGMENFAKLIHKSNATYVPTKLPVQFYGLPDGKVYLIYASFYEVGYEKSGIEYVIAVQEEFLFDYESEKLYYSNAVPNNSSFVYNEYVDKPNPKIKIEKVYRSIHSFGQAFTILNKKAQTLKNNLKKEDNIKIFPFSDDKYKQA